MLKAPKEVYSTYSRFAFLVVGFFTVLVVGKDWIQVTLGLGPADAIPRGFDDDFFYYFVIAKNIVLHGLSSFDGVTITNGYHPLWMLLITGLVWTGATDEVLFRCLLCLQVSLALVTFLLVRMYAERLLGQTWVALLSAIVVFFMTVTYFRGGMEIVVTLPLVMVLGVLILEGYDSSARPMRLFAFGCASSLLVLARIDSVLLLTVWFFTSATALHPGRRDLRRLAIIVLGLLPVLAYFSFNYVTFGSILTISGQAKNLKQSILPSLTPWMSLLPYDKNTRYLVKVFLPFLVGIVGLGLFIVKWRNFREHGAEKRTLTIFLTFPVIYYLAISIRSDWPLWDQYFYPLPAAFLSALVLMLKGRPRLTETLNRHGQSLTVAMLALIFALPLYRFSLPPSKPSIYTTAKVIVEFAGSHSGRVYAMGDRAGATGYLLNKAGARLLQLEGLVGDRAMVENIRKQANLTTVLQQYGVEYYVALPEKYANGCYETLEPARAGPTSPKMKGVFCYEPIATIDDGPLRTFIFATNRASSTDAVQHKNQETTSNTTSPSASKTW